MLKVRKAVKATQVQQLESKDRRVTLEHRERRAHRDCRASKAHRALLGPSMTHDHHNYHIISLILF